jgi:hypothetical protein
LLLGLCRETAIGGRVEVEKLRDQIRLPANPKLPTSVDVPLSAQSKRIFAHTAEEAEWLSSRTIDCLHLALGMLREPECGAAQWLLAAGLDRQTLIELLAPKPTAPALEPLRDLVESSVKALRRISDPDRRLQPEGWTAKQALAHLLDLSVANDRWLQLPDAPATSIQLSPANHWAELVSLWASVNRKIVDGARQIPADRWTPLRQSLLEFHIARTEMVMRQILA